VWEAREKREVKLSQPRKKKMRERNKIIRRGWEIRVKRDLTNAGGTWRVSEKRGGGSACLRQGNGACSLMKKKGKPCRSGRKPSTSSSRWGLGPYWGKKGGWTKSRGNDSPGSGGRSQKSNGVGGQS